MRSYTKLRAKLNREVAAMRADYLKEFPICVVCWQFVASQVHEITRGTAGRPLSIGESATWLALCTFCNTSRLCDYSKWPIERQLAVKLRHDPERFDLEVIWRIRGRAPSSITLKDVVQYLELAL